MDIAAASGRFVVCFARRAENIFLSGKAPFLSTAAWKKAKQSPCWSTCVKVVESGPPVDWSKLHPTQLYDMLVVLENMDMRFTMNWLLFPPATKEVQLDEKWGFVYKKEANCDPHEEARGDNWDHTALDAEHRLLLSVVPGKRTPDKCHQVVAEVKKRTGGRTDILLTTDEYASYKPAIRSAYEEEDQQPEHHQRKKAKRSMPKDLCYATVRKTRKGGRVVSVLLSLVFGAFSVLVGLLYRSSVSSMINTSFVERHNGTDRNQNARKARKTLKFSKDWDAHNAMTYFVAYSYNFCWPVRTLQVKDERGKWSARTPAMAAGLADHVWSTREWVLFPARPG